MHDFLREMLICPACHGDLTWSITERQGDRVEIAEAQCKQCKALYPVREGIGLFLTPDLPREDLWVQADDRLTRHLSEHPEIAHQLMDVPLATLSPADQMFRMFVLEERRDYLAAKEAGQVAMAGMYTAEYQACSQSQYDYLLDRLSSVQGPIIDLASGRCYLATLLAEKLDQPIVVTDFSPHVLRRDRQRFQLSHLYERISLLAFDARRTPFKDGALETLTTYVGLANIGEPDVLLLELRRIVSGKFWAVSHFYSVEDQVNAAAIDKMGLSNMLYRAPTLSSFTASGWQVEIANECAGKALPTPVSVIFDGMGIDGLPVAETVLNWCTLIAQ